MKVILAGGTGFVGRHVVPALRARGHEVVVLSRGTRDPLPGVQAVRWDVSGSLPAPAGLEGADAFVNLVSPLFPVVGLGHAVLQPVAVQDVAEAVAAALDRPHCGGRTYDLVGARRLTLRQVVRTVARGLGLPLLILPVPVAVQRLAVAVMNRMSRNPLSTPAQLRMLAEGLTGDPEPARAELALAPRSFDAEAVRALAKDVPPLLGFSLRLMDGPEARTWLARRGADAGRALVLAALAMALMLALSGMAAGVWPLLTVLYLVLVPLTLVVLRSGWQEILRPSGRHVLAGTAAALLLHLAARLTLALLKLSASLALQLQAIQAWRTALPAWLSLPLLTLVIVPGEEVVWRGGLTLALVGRLGPVLGCAGSALAFAAFHAPLGLPVVVLASFGAGLFWSALVVKTRSLVPALVCHLLWDLLVMYGPGF